jgi:subfamily B ATP-binding cassette protein HlyB/CyaB
LRSTLGDAAHHEFEPNDDAAAQDPAETESALLARALVMLLRCHGIGAEPEQIRYRIGSIGVGEMLRCAKEMGLKARSRRDGSGWSPRPLPGIAVLRDGSFLILGRAAPDKVLVQRPMEQRPETMTRL